MVMCSEPVTRTPASGFATAYLRRIDIRPGISCSAMEISLRPHAASDKSATLNSAAVWLFAAWLSAAVLIVAVPIFFNLVSINLDTLILYCFIYGVNPKIAAAGGGPEPVAYAPA